LQVKIKTSNIEFQRERKQMSSEEVTLRQIAIMIWHSWSPEARAAKETIETEQKRKIESFRTELRRIVGESFDINIKINGGCVEAEIEDLRFVAYELTMPKTKEICTLVSLVGRCPSCGTETTSKPVGTLASLGRMLEKFEPTFEHFCPTLHRSRDQLHK
jgi:hypothetical protein